MRPTLLTLTVSAATQSFRRPIRIAVPQGRSELRRMLVEVPLIYDERAAVESDKHAVGNLIDLLTDVPSPAGPTPRELGHTTDPDHGPPTEKPR